MSNGDGLQSLGQAGGIWGALLDFATSVGSNDLVNQTPSSFHQMSEQDKEFLTNAMASFMKESDPVKQLKDNLDILMQLEYGNPNEEQKLQGVAALEHIIDLCCSLDLATDFHKLGGFRVLVPLLASSASEFRENAASLIGELAQNHAYCQNALHDANVLPVLLKLMDLDPNNNVRTKALFAISCLTRNNAKLEQQFVNLDGFSYLLRATMSDFSRLSVKACFLLSSILGKEQNKEKAIQVGLVNQLVAMLGQQTQTAAYEQTAAALLALVTDCPKAIQLCRNPDLGLKKILEDRLTAVGSDSADQQISAMAMTSQEVENKRILEELQQRKRQMMMKNVGGPSAVSMMAPSRVNANVSKDHFAPVEMGSMTAPQKHAWQAAQTSCYASFVVQDSVFGNLLLPLVPRVSQPAPIEPKTE